MLGPRIADQMPCRGRRSLSSVNCVLQISVPLERPSRRHRRLPFWPVLAGVDAACGLVMVLLGVLVAGAAGSIAVAFGVAVLAESGWLAFATRRVGSQ